MTSFITLLSVSSLHASAANHHFLSSLWSLSSEGECAAFPAFQALIYSFTYVGNARENSTDNIFTGSPYMSSIRYAENSTTRSRPRARTPARATRDPSAHLDVCYWGQESWTGAQARCARSALMRPEERGTCARAGDEREPEEGRRSKKHDNFITHLRLCPTRTRARACAPTSRRANHPACEVQSR